MSEPLPDDLPEFIKRLMELNNFKADYSEFNGHRIVKLSSNDNQYKCDDDIESMIKDIERANKCMYMELT